MRLIDADALHELIDGGFDIDFDEVPETKAELLRMIDTAPTIEERKPGRWIESNPQNSKICRLINCSECGKGYIVNINVPYEDWTDAHKFCVECGAKMEVEHE